MSGKDRLNITANAMGRLMDRLKRTVVETDENKDPQQRGYSRVDTADSLLSGTISNSSTSTSLDTVLIENNNELQPISRLGGGAVNQHKTLPKSFSPIPESEESGNKDQNQKQKQPEKQKTSSLKVTIGDNNKVSKSSLRNSKVSFENRDHSSSEEEDNFEERRHHFQHKKANSADHRGILKDLNHLSIADDRKAFQSKKHVSLDVKHARLLERILNGSSSDEDFVDRRKQFQGRKHQSLDARVKFNLDKERSTTSSSEEELDSDGKHLIHERIHDFSKPIIIDIKDLETSEDEDFVSTRQSFQQQRSISTDSRKSHRFYEMDEIGGKKNENLRNAVPFVRQITQDGKPKLEVYRPTTNPIYIYTQVIAALSVSLGSMVVGFSSGYTSPALPSMKDANVTHFEVTEHAGSWVGGIMPLAGLVGGVMGGPMIEYLGRKNTILATAVPFIIAWMLIALAVNVWMILAGRALSGFCVGVASLSLPVYLGETVQPEVRGTLGLLPTAFGNIGILLCFVAGRYLTWAQLAFLGGALPIPFLLSMLIIPETPRWYVANGKDEKARRALQWLRGRKADVEPELKGIIKTHNEAERHASSNGLAKLFKRSNLKPLSISLGLMLFQQFSGINAVIFYAEDIFNYAGTNIEGSICVIIVGVVNFAATFMATIMIDRAGRKILLYISAVGMIISLCSLGGYFFAKNSGSHVENIGWLPLASLMMYVVCFSLGYGPIPWLMMGEILPAKIRGTAASVATGFNWTCTFVVTKSFQNIIDAFGLSGAFWLFACICAVGLVFVILYVPETQGKSLEDIERKMMGRVRRMSSVANIKPLSFNM